MNSKLAPMFWMIGVLVLIWTSADAGENPNFTIPLHAKVSSPELCSGYLPVNCSDILPTVSVPANTTVTVFVFVFNFERILGLSVAFDCGEWMFLGGAWDCQPGQLTPEGIGCRSIATGFQGCGLMGPGLAVIGRMVYRTADGSCLEIVQSSYPFGLHAVDCSGGFDQINPEEEPLRLGKICVGDGGRTGCGRFVPVEAATWGRIKATY